VGNQQTFVHKLEIPKTCSWMHFIWAQIMYYSIWRSGKWHSIYKIHFTECAYFRGHEDHH
jgi:hypothetical protein